jgi:hypothetical protein
MKAQLDGLVVRDRDCAMTFGAASAASAAEVTS